MSTNDQTHSARIHGEALLAAQDDSLRPLLEQLAEATDSPEVRAEVAGALAGEWLAEPGSALADRLIAAGLLLTSGEVDYDRLQKAVQEATARVTLPPERA